MYHEEPLQNLVETPREFDGNTLRTDKTIPLKTQK
jgi:hypothetical protein